MKHSQDEIKLQRLQRDIKVSRAVRSPAYFLFNGDVLQHATDLFSVSTGDCISLPTNASIPSFSRPSDYSEISAARKRQMPPEKAGSLTKSEKCVRQ
jgi:hypothetical protein